MESFDKFWTLTGSRFSYRKKCNYTYDILHLFRRSEEQVYAAAMAWVKHNIAERRQHLPVVLQHVRMPLLSPKFLVCFIFIPVKLHTLILVHWIWDHYLWQLLRFFDCLAHPNLSALSATDQKWPLRCFCISYQSVINHSTSFVYQYYSLLWHCAKLW